MDYKGIELDVIKGTVARSHSVVMDAIRGEDSSQNTVWTELLDGIPWGEIKDKVPEAFEDAGRLWSLINMDYQICNGGIGRYFGNGYHTEREPFNADDVWRYDIDEQKKDFLELVEFGQVIFPERVEENAALLRAARAFDELVFEENAEIEVLVECDEDQYIWDDDLQEEVENPDWFEEYYETEYEDVIHNENGFDNIFYAANDYMEELFEMKAQLIYKTLAKELDIVFETDPELAEDTTKRVLALQGEFEFVSEAPNKEKAFEEFAAKFHHVGKALKMEYDVEEKAVNVEKGYGVSIDCEFEVDAASGKTDEALVVEFMEELEYLGEPIVLDYQVKGTPDKQKAKTLAELIHDAKVKTDRDAGLEVSRGVDMQL